MLRTRLFSIFAVVILLAVACAQPQATTAPVATATPGTEPVAEGTATQAALTIGNLPDVPRNQQVVLGWSISSPIGVTNPWAVPGYTHQEGNVFLWEPLAYYGIFSSTEIPWLADSMEYTKDDFTELTIKLNPLAKWSDGEAVTSADVVYTFEGQLNRDTLPYHAAFEQFVESVAAPDDLTVVVTFKIPAPRFKYEVLTFKFDTGIPIVPEHVLGAQEDVNAFVGGLEMAHSGPYNLVTWDANQKIYDLRSDWWAVEAGKSELPAVKRIVMVNIGGQVGQNMDIVVQRLVNNEFDAILDVRSSVAAQILASNDKVTTHSGSESPYGYLDWWPNSLWMNTQLEPYNNPDVRRAMSLTIDRATINEIVYDGAEIATIYPFPLYPNLQAFADSPAVKAMEEQYQPGKFDLDESAALMTAAGYAKNGDGLWEKDGATIDATIQAFEGIHSDIVPILVEMLRNGGFDASVNFGTDAYQNMADGKAGLYMFGHGASTVDPYAALELFHSRFSASIGTSAGNNRFSRYVNPEFDALLDEMAPLDATDPRFQELAAEALGIYWRDTIDIPVIQWLHRIPYNQTYWTNWPTATNLADGENGAFWHGTGPLVITGLKATGAQ
jgi:ABC-type transport system substrate-binding protein